MDVAKDIAGELGKKFEKTPGFGYVALIVSTALGIVLNSATQPAGEEPHWSIAFFTLAIALAAYWCGGLLDEFLFEPFYGLPPEKERKSGLLRRLMRSWLIRPLRGVLARSTLAVGVTNARQKAAQNFHPTNQRGIYKSAKKLLSNTDAWEGRIKLTLDLSKTARTIIIPALVLFLWEVGERVTRLPGPAFLRNQPSTAWLSLPLVPFLVALLATAIYINLRLRHMRLLYEELDRMRPFSFQVAERESSRVVIMWSVGDKVIAQSQIPVCVAPDTGA